MGSMRFGMDFWVCMMIILSLNLGFLKNGILNLDFLKLRLVKPTRNKIIMGYNYGFRTNPNKSLCMGYNPYLSCLEIIQEKFLKIHM